MDNWLSALLSGLGALYQPTKDLFHSISSRNQEVSTRLPAHPIEQQTEQHYQEILGQRHKDLREDILGLSLREMSNLYGLEKASYLKAYEDGADELPNEFIEKLVQIFFVSPEYIQEGINPVFRTFDNYNGRNDCLDYLEQNFKPYFLCSPSFEEDGYAYLVFWKEDKGYQRIISSDDKGYRRIIRADYISCFHSNNGGAISIHNFIEAMLDLNLNPDWLYISFLNVSSDEWQKLSECRWYEQKLLGGSGEVNSKARDIFEKCFKKVQEERSNYQASLGY